uniref:Uncharacterized protein n=1 Tax=viral metagenome TaxID=1070528 RepID=A0A6C0CGW4_9ZZZZ
MARNKTLSSRVSRKNKTMRRSNNNRMRRSKNKTMRKTKRINNSKIKKKKNKKLTIKQLKYNLSRMMGGSGITVNQLKSYLGDDWERDLKSIEQKIRENKDPFTALGEYYEHIESGKKSLTLKIIEKINQNKTVFFDKLYDAVNSNNDFTDAPNGPLRNSYFLETHYPTLYNFKVNNGIEIEYDNLFNLKNKLKKMTSSEHMTNLESQVGGGKMIYIPDKKKKEFANLLLEAEGIKKQFIIRSVEVLKQMDPDYFKLNPDIINKALEIYFEGEGKERLLNISVRIIDNTNDHNYKQAFRNIKTNMAHKFFSKTRVGKKHKKEEAAQANFMSGMFGNDDY